MVSSPTVRKIHETITAKAAQTAAKEMQKSTGSTSQPAPKATEIATKTAQKTAASASKLAPKSLDSSVKTTQKPLSRPVPALLSSPVAQPVFCSSNFDDGDSLLVLDEPLDSSLPSAGSKRPHAPNEVSPTANKKPAAAASVLSPPAQTTMPKPPTSSQHSVASQSLSRSSPVAASVNQAPLVTSNASTPAVQPLRPGSSKVLPSQPNSSSAAGLAPSAVAALQAKIQAAAKSDVCHSRQNASALPGGGPVAAPRKDNSQLMDAARKFGVDVEAVKMQHSAHEHIADQSIKEREQRHADMLFAAAKLEERQMGVMETKVSVWKCTQCSYIGYRYCPLHENKVHNERKEVTQRYFSCCGCKHRIAWLKGPICSVKCSKCSGSLWKQCSQFKGKVGSSEDEWKKANTPSEFSLYHQR
jgi:hypothetical protein